MHQDGPQHGQMLCLDAAMEGEHWSHVVWDTMVRPGRELVLDHFQGVLLLQGELQVEGTKKSASGMEVGGK